jgi:hypothetical protein
LRSLPSPLRGDEFSLSRFEVGVLMYRCDQNFDRGWRTFMKKTVVFTVLVAIVAGAIGYFVGLRRAERELSGVVLAESVKEISVYANGLNTLRAQDADRVSRLLDSQLRLSLDTAETELPRAVLAPIKVSSLMEGIRRAETHAQATGDEALRARLERLRVGFAKVAR